MPPWRICWDILDDPDLATGLFPRIEPGYRLFEKEPEDEEVRIDFRKKFLSVMLLRDLPFGGGKPPNYHLGGEVYHPNLCAKQLGCPQLIPLRSYRRCPLNNSAYARFIGLPDSSSATKVLFDGWDSWIVHAGAEAKKFMMQTIKDINAQVIEGTLWDKLFRLEKCLVEQPTIEVTLFAKRNKRKETVQPETSAESPHPPPTRSKRLRKIAMAESEEIEELAAVPTETSRTDEELREAFEAVGQKKEVDVSTGDKRKGKEVEDEEEIPAEIIAESIALAKQQQEAQTTGPTSSELAIFDAVEAEHSAVVLEPEVEANHSIDVPIPEVEEEKTIWTLAVVTSPFKPHVVAMPIHSVPGSFTTTSFANPELAEFEAMDLDAQLDKLEKLNSSPGKAKSKVVGEAVDRVRI
ncbi:unnamed protein product [Prunus armeniaca]